jgi:hypothetical protein
MFDGPGKRAEPMKAASEGHDDLENRRVGDTDYRRHRAVPTRPECPSCLASTVLMSGVLGAP